MLYVINIVSLITLLFGASAQADTKAPAILDVPPLIHSLRQIPENWRTCLLQFTPIWLDGFGDRNRRPVIEIAAICHFDIKAANGDVIPFVNYETSKLDTHAFQVPRLCLWDATGGDLQQDLRWYETELHGLPNDLHLAHLRKLLFDYELQQRIYEMQSLPPEERQEFLERNLGFTLGHTAEEIRELRAGMGKNAYYDGSSIEEKLAYRSDNTLLQQIRAGATQELERRYIKYFEPTAADLERNAPHLPSSGVADGFLGLSTEGKYWAALNGFYTEKGTDAVINLLQGSDDPIVAMAAADYIHRTGPFADETNRMITAGLMLWGGTALTAVENTAAIFGSVYLAQKFPLGAAKLLDKAELLTQSPALRAQMARFLSTTAISSERALAAVVAGKAAAVTMSTTGITGKAGEAIVATSTAVLGDSAAAHFVSGVAVNTVTVALPVLLIGPTAGADSLRVRFAAALVGAFGNNFMQLSLTSLNSWADARERGTSFDPFTQENMKNFNLSSAGSSLYIVAAMLGSMHMGHGVGISMETDDAQGSFRQNLQQYLASGNLSALGLRTLSTLLDADSLIGTALGNKQATPAQIAQHRDFQTILLEETARAANLDIETTRTYMQTDEGRDWVHKRIETLRRIQTPQLIQHPTQLAATGTDSTTPYAMAGNPPNDGGRQPAPRPTSNGNSNASDPGNRGRAAKPNGGNAAKQSPPARRNAPQQQLTPWGLFTACASNCVKAVTSRYSKISLTDQELRAAALWSKPERREFIQSIIGPPPVGMPISVIMPYDMAHVHIERNLDAAIRKYLLKSGVAELTQWTTLMGLVDQFLEHQGRDLMQQDQVVTALQDAIQRLEQSYGGTDAPPLLFSSPTSLRRLLVRRIAELDTLLEHYGLDDNPSIQSARNNNHPTQLHEWGLRLEDWADEGQRALDREEAQREFDNAAVDARTGIDPSGLEDEVEIVGTEALDPQVTDETTFIAAGIIDSEDTVTEADAAGYQELAVLHAKEHLPILYAWRTALFPKLFNRGNFQVDLAGLIERSANLPGGQIHASTLALFCQDLNARIGRIEHDLRVFAADETRSTKEAALTDSAALTPNLDDLFSTVAPVRQQASNGASNGYITPDSPEWATFLDILHAEVRFTFSRSSGPGGSNANKVNSKATLHWDIYNSRVLHPTVRDRLVELFGNRISRTGDFQISSDRFRYQRLNISDCLERLDEMMEQAATKPPERRR